MILDRVTLKRGKTHNGQGLPDPIAHVVTDVNADLGVEFIEMRVPLTSKYGSRVLLATYTSILLVVSLLDKDIRS